MMNRNCVYCYQIAQTLCAASTVVPICPHCGSRVVYLERFWWDKWIEIPAAPKMAGEGESK